MQLVPSLEALSCPVKALSVYHDCWNLGPPTSYLHTARIPLQPHGSTWAEDEYPSMQCWQLY